MNVELSLTCPSDACAITRPTVGELAAHMIEDHSLKPSDALRAARDVLLALTMPPPRTGERGGVADVTAGTTTRDARVAPHGDADEETRRGAELRALQATRTSPADLSKSQSAEAGAARRQLERRREGDR